jgi:hypothetical protein
MKRPSLLRRALFVLGIGLLPLAVLLQEAAFRFPKETEQVYGHWTYPYVAYILGGLNQIVDFSLAEAIGAVLLLGALVWTIAKWRRRRHKKDKWWIVLLRAVATLWILAGSVAWAFLLLWGLNYARPSLREQLDLSAEDIEDEEVLDAGKRCAILANSLYSALGVSPDHPTTVPLEFRELNEVIDERLRELSLPGDSIQYPTSPVKKLFLSKAMSYLGISGVFIPFTGEPSMNGMIPDVFTPIAVAHEKAHQRGIANEGEANLVAFLTCSGAERYTYLRYSAYLYAATQLIGAVSLRLPDEAKDAWNILGEGPRRDLTAVREFWARYEGRIAEVARDVNDTYLRSQRVPGGVESYSQVTQLLVALDRQQHLTSAVDVIGNR